MLVSQSAPLILGCALTAPLQRGLPRTLALAQAAGDARGATVLGQKVWPLHLQEASPAIEEGAVALGTRHAQLRSASSQSIRGWWPAFLDRQQLMMCKHKAKGVKGSAWTHLPQQAIGPRGPIRRGRGALCCTQSSRKKRRKNGNWALV